MRILCWIVKCFRPLLLEDLGRMFHHSFPTGALRKQNKNEVKMSSLLWAGRYRNVRYCYYYYLVPPVFSLHSQTEWSLHCPLHQTDFVSIINFQRSTVEILLVEGPPWWETTSHLRLLSQEVSCHVSLFKIKKFKNRLKAISLLRSLVLDSWGVVAGEVSCCLRK